MMTRLEVAWRKADPGAELIAVIDGQVREQYSEPVQANANVIVVRHTQAGRAPEFYEALVREGLSVPADLDVLIVPLERELIVFATEAISHFLRLADATLKPLPDEPEPMTLAPGDAYVALIPGRQPLTPEARLAAARFIHMRDDFNADTMAAGLLKDLLAADSLAGQAQPALGALVIECR